MKKRVLSLLLVFVIVMGMLPVSVFAAKPESYYTVTMNGSTTAPKEFTTLAALMADGDVISGGTDTEQKLVQLYNIDFDSTNMLSMYPWGGAKPALIISSIGFGYTTFEYNNCTFEFGYMDGYETTPHNGLELRFVDCTFSDYGLYGFTGNGGRAVDLYFERCKSKEAPVTGGGLAGDVTMIDCMFTGMVNVNAGGSKENYYVNSRGELATFKIQNCQFVEDPFAENPTLIEYPSGSIAIYANLYHDYIIEDCSHAFYFYEANTYFAHEGSNNVYECLNSTGVSDSIEHLDTETGRKAIYAITPARVKYDANGGVGSVVDNESYPYSRTACFTAKNNTFTREGFTPDGWRTAPGDDDSDAEGNPGVVVEYYADGATVYIPFGTTTYTLYANWKEGAPTTYKVIYSWSGDIPTGVTEPKDTNTYDTEEAAKAAVDTTYKIGYTVTDGLDVYTFSGWTASTSGYVTSFTGTWTKSTDDDVLTDPTQDKDPNTPGDGIADKYQMEVAFKAVNGKFEGDLANYTTVVTKLKEGVPAANGTATIATEHVKSASADTGYTGGVWTSEANATITTPVGQTVTAENDVFTITYAPTTGSATVTFKVVNGQWDDATTADKTVTVNLTAGKGTLDSAEVPAVGNKPDVNYQAGSWNTIPNTATDGVTGDVTYTYSFKMISNPPSPPLPPVVPSIGSVTLTKVDAEDKNTTLANVIFDLYRADGTREGTYTTGADGTITVNNLPVGKHYWIEIRPAEGYILDTSKHEFTVIAGKTTKINVTNARSATPGVFSSEHYAYVIGYDDGLVHPEDYITRAEVATIFFRLLDDATRERYMTENSGFPDVKDGMWFHAAATTMAAMGIINGRPDGNFYPYANITRAEFAAIAVRFDSGGNTTGMSFRDIYGHWAQKEINVAYNNGWVLGYEDGTFRPDQNITRAEAMTIINRVLQRTPEWKTDLLEHMVMWPDNMDTTKWYYLAIQEATNSHSYGRKSNGYEYWTELRPVRDWRALEE